MINKRIMGWAMTVCLLFALSASAQTSKTAERSWNAFWKSFSAAVNKKSRAAVKALMVSERDFSSGGGMETRDQWLRLVEQKKWWGLLQDSVRSGTRAYDYEGRPSRITNDNHLIFAFIGGRWRFIGVMGD